MKNNYDEDKWWRFGAILLFIIFIGWIVARGVFTFAVEVAHAQEVTASVSCNETNRLYSSSCMDWDAQNNVTGEIMGIPFMTYWINPERMLFWTAEGYWYVTPNGIEY